MDRGVFSEDEIKAIVARRRESEYLIRRRSVRKADFLRYLSQEIQLEKLRELRMKKKNIKKNDVGDKHIVQHVHFVFSRLLRKFRSDVSLYLQYIDFCKSTNSLKTLGRIYAQALQVHPRNVGLWIEAASHEFFSEGSVGNARVLLQRALRVNRKSQDLWLQYFLLELHYIQKLKGRREVLQLEENKEKQDDSVDSLAIPMVVYNNAIQAIPDSVVFRLKFLDQCNMFPSTQEVEQYIVETIARDFEQDAQAWIARAAHAANTNNKDETKAVGFQVDMPQEGEPMSKRQKTNDCNPVLAVLEEAVDTLPSAEMYVKSIQFLRSLEDEEDAYQLFIHKLLIQAKDKEIESAELVLEEADVLVHEGKLGAAMETLKQHALSCKTMESVTIWLQWAKLCAVSNECDVTASHVLRMALERTPLYSKEQMVILLELFGALLAEATSDDYKSELKQLFERILLLSAGTMTAPFDDDEAVFGVSSVADACLQYLRFCFSTGGMDAARNVYEQVFYRSNYCVGGKKTGAELETIQQLMDEAIQMEAKEEKTKKTKQRLRRLYDTAIKFFDEVNPAVADAYRSQRDSNVRFAKR